MATSAHVLGRGAVLTSLLLLAGCGADPQGEPDCSARIQFHGTVFRLHNLVNQLAPADAGNSGIGEVLGCRSTAIDHVDIHKIRGVDPDLAIAVTGEKWPGVYVRDGTGPTDWPTQLLASGS